MAISKIVTNSIASSVSLTTPSVPTTFGVGGATPSSSGAGVSFPAVLNNSTDVNTLDDYEEGTFSPTFAATGCTFNYSYQAGAYTKVGRMVTVMIAIGLLGSGNSFNGNALTISNLPFPVLAGALYWNNVPVNFQALTTSVVGLTGRASNGTVIDLFKITAAATSPTTMAANDLSPTNGNCVVYLVATYST